jgi:hypothetical protein
MEETSMVRIWGSGKVALAFAAALWLVLGPASTARADYAESRIWFENLSPGEREGLQNQLFWSGYYLAPVDGAFGPLTYDALTAFQTSAGELPTGVLSYSQRALLQDEADRIRQLVAYVNRQSKRPARRVARAPYRSARYSTPSYTPVILP